MILSLCTKGKVDILLSHYGCLGATSVEADDWKKEVESIVKDCL